jgi:hypothetical protein
MKSLGTPLVFLVAVVALTFLSVRYGLGRLPGDLIIDRGGLVIYLPITSAVLWLFRR